MVEEAGNIQTAQRAPGVSPAAVLGLMLLAAVILSAVGRVYSVHKSRQLFSELQVLVKQEEQLQVEWGQLLLEESSWAAPQRVEAIARNKLQMDVPATDAIAILNL